MKARQGADASPYKGPDGNAVRQMFSEIAPRYDFLNHLLSASVDRRWRRQAVDKVAEHVRHRDMVCLDLCCGTGDLALELHRRLKTRVIAADFCHPMLVRSAAKTKAAGFDHLIDTVEADSMTLPFPRESFDAVTIAFGLRNLEDPRTGLEGMRRTLRHDGIAVVLEFSRPVVPVLREAFQVYFQHVLPRLGALVSGQNTAYRYLPESVGRFPSQNELAGMMERTGFRNVGYRNLSGGIAALHWGSK